MESIALGRLQSGIVGDFPVWGMRAVLRPLQGLMATPSLLFLATLTAMLLRHPDVAFYEIDRIAFALLLVGVLGRGMVQRQRLFVVERATWPMIGLTALAGASVIRQPFDHETWSLLASKLIVPFVLFHLAGLVFTSEKKFRQFEVFALIVLGYLKFYRNRVFIGSELAHFPSFHSG